MEFTIQSNKVYGLKSMFANAKLRQITNPGLPSRVADMLSHQVLANQSNSVTFDYPKMNLSEIVKVGLKLNRLKFRGVRQKIVITMTENAYTIKFKSI